MMKVNELMKQHYLLLSFLRLLRSDLDKEISNNISQLRKLKTEKRITKDDIYYANTPLIRIRVIDTLKYIIFKTRRKEIKEQLGYSNYKAESCLSYLKRWIEFIEHKNEEKITIYKEIIQKKKEQK
jgi:hypothetical protein